MSINGIYNLKNKEVKVWNAKDIEIDLDIVGLELPTNVYRSFTRYRKAKE